MIPIILASGSVYRQRQLQQLQLDVQTQTADVDETLIFNESPPDRAGRLAIAKANKVKNQHKAAIVIGSDQVCALGHRIYRKPGNRENNLQQLRDFSGQTVVFYTALCVLGADDHQHFHINETKVQFRCLSETEIIRYVDKEQAYDCAGGFKMERLGLSLMASVSSDDPSALMGLPLIQLCAFLRELGVELP
ncbi:MAG: Maf family protein [Marinicella pacifica]